MTVWIPVNRPARLRAAFRLLIGTIMFAAAGLSAAAVPSDSDADGVPDTLDNCIYVANADQRDTDGDGYGNICDADFNNNGVVDSSDGVLMKSRFGSTRFPDQDLDGNGVVDSRDGAREKALFGRPPGPSGRVSPSTNRPPAIAGVPPATVVAGQAYAFTPTASDPEGRTLTFNINGAPPWASFNSITGTLSGTPGPAQVGQFAGIVITASDGTNYVSLPAFSILVVQATAGSATVSWQPPFQRADGSPLTNLAGYQIRYGKSPLVLGYSVAVNNPGLTRYVVDGLSPATWFFAVAAIDGNGQKSALSNVGAKTLP